MRNDKRGVVSKEVLHMFCNVAYFFFKSDIEREPHFDWTKFCDLPGYNLNYSSFVLLIKHVQIL